MMRIAVVEYNPDWVKQFYANKTMILQAVEQFVTGVEHVGSTAVPNLSAKPTIDICIGVTTLNEVNERIIPPLQKLGFDYLPALESGIPERRYLQKLNEKSEHLVHIHIVVKGERLWNEYINFRDYLIAHPEEAHAYNLLKLELKEKFAYDREAYTNGKANFIQAILRKAIVWKSDDKEKNNENNLAASTASYSRDLYNRK
ncbi:MAG: GrpB family protein [Gammaproteobacteria bacterium]|nr:GrpB family protein [Gammaproteobacteria bacterium]